MAEKRFWRRIDIDRVNLVLCALIVVLSLAYHRELSWAARELPGFLRGKIDAPLERRLYMSASRILREKGDKSRALPLLEKSLNIDPYSEAVFWLGVYYFETGNLNGALTQFNRYREIDPAYVYSYLYCARIHKLRKENREVRRVLQEGCDALGDYENYVPHPDASVSDIYNEKAREHFLRRQESYFMLQHELARFDKNEEAGRGIPLKRKRIPDNAGQGPGEKE
jgi:tetratricopeptide (TPR) repeat protein